MRVNEETGDSGAEAAGNTALLSDPSVGALQRILLNTDGTVVQILEAFFDDPIRLGSHVQFEAPLSPADADLEPDGQETVLRRKVMLQGSRTGRNYIYANTAVLLDRLDAPVRDDLLATSKPIGWVLRAHRTETFREMLHMGRRRVGPLASEFGMDPADELLFRIYRIIARGRPIMLLAEHFPARHLEPVAPSRAPSGGGPPDRSPDEGATG